MMRKVFLLYCMLIASIFQKANLSSQSYYAAVVEYHVEYIPGNSAEERLMKRAKDHIDILKSIDQKLEIIVFPEKSITPYGGNMSVISTKIPNNFDKIICNSTDPIYKEYLKLFSCAAIEYDTTIAINVIEEDNCLDNNCGYNLKNKKIYYNTVVVFDEKGYVSGRYRKWNLFGEFELSSPDDLDVTVIKTKNNISFGVFTCFDINFNIPSVNLTRNLKIKNMIFPNRWISELPYLTALQAQQMWAHENNVVLLASGANYPSTGASGSGIFHGKNGPIESVFIGGNGGTKVILQKVTSLDEEILQTPPEEDTDHLAIELDTFFLLRDLSMDDHTSVLMNENEPTVVQEVCNGESNKLCCNFDITINTNKSEVGKYRYKYHLVSFNGIRSFSGLRDAGIEACGIVACLNDSLSSCGLRFLNYSEIAWPITFEKIKIEGSFLNDENRAQYPNSLRSSLRPILPKYTLWEKEESGKYIIRKHVLNKTEKKLLTFGIFGRDIGRDNSSKKPSDNGAKKLEEMCIMVLIFNIIIIKLV